MAAEAGVALVHSATCNDVVPKGLGSGEQREESLHLLFLVSLQGKVDHRPSRIDLLFKQIN
jgi:hypothetical protein